MGCTADSVPGHGQPTALNAPAAPFTVTSMKIESPPLMTRYIMMSFGADDYRYWQAHWLILSLMAHAPRPYEIRVVTDHPRYFGWFGDAVRVHGMTTAEVADWIGPQGYFFRTLIKCLEFALATGPEAGAVVYLDTDTVVNRGLAPLIADVARGIAYMDCVEYVIHESGRQGNKGARTLWDALGDTEWMGIRIHRELPLWNTGITAVGGADAPLISKALAVCDAMLASGVTHRLTEQVALSAVLTAAKQVKEVNPARREPWITHYWENKHGWHESITARLATIHHRGLTLAEAVEFLLQNPIDRPRIVKRTRKWHRLLKVEPAK